MTVLQAPPPTRHELASAAATIIATVNQHAREHNRRWGFNRLPHLVPIEWTERFTEQKRKWELACWECTGSPKAEDIDRIRKHGEAMIRAYDKLAALAIEAGHDPGPHGKWEFELTDGTPVVIVRDRAEMSQVDTGGRAAQVWSLEEIAGIVSRFPELIRAKDAFPGAEVVQMRTSPKITDALNDSLADLPGFG